jgi:hypothetical protein
MIVLMLIVLDSAAAAGDRGEGMVGRLFLFQKCDENGCPEIGNGPWPIIPDNRCWGQMKYNLLGPEFRYSFQGKNLDPETSYTLIYYPDPWPGAGLVCLGNGRTNSGGNIQIHGKKQFLDGENIVGLPLPDDVNFNPVEPSGAVGAKIWLVLSADVDCTEDATKMNLWNPASYLFEGNLIIYQYMDAVPDDAGEPDDDAGDRDIDDQEPEEESAAAPEPQNHGKGNAEGKSK